MSVPLPSPQVVTERLRKVARLSDLAPERRLYAKLDMSAAGVTRRLRTASELRDLCSQLRRVAETAS